MASPIASVQAAEIGRQINFPQGVNPPNFTGATVRLLVTNPSGASLAFTCSIAGSGSGQYPTYNTLGTEFPSAGKYNVQLEYENGGERYFSPSGIVQVLPNLTAV